MQLTKEQIQSLFTFTKQHFVEWYDLQCELVDHLANDIEYIWQTEPNLSFEDARDKSFKKFGVYGFSDVIEKKQTELYKKYWKLTWKYLKAFFKLPKILLTAFLIAVTYTLIHEVDNKGTVISWIIFCACALLTIDIYKRHRAIKKRQNETGKKWLFQNNLDVMNGISIVMLPIHCYNSLRIVNWTNNKEIIASVLVVLYLIICFIMIKILPKKLEEEASKLYPEYNLYKKA